jgi:hypothetical protein
MICEIAASCLIESLCLIFTGIVGRTVCVAAIDDRLQLIEIGRRRRQTFNLVAAKFFDCLSQFICGDDADVIIPHSDGNGSGRNQLVVRDTETIQQDQIFARGLPPRCHRWCNLALRSLISCDLDAGTTSTVATGLSDMDSWSAIGPRNATTAWALDRPECLEVGPRLSVPDCLRPCYSVGSP